MSAEWNVHDVVAYILARTGTITAFKMHKLVYYAQAWSLVWDERPLFDEQIKAWANGPVVRELYDRHKGFFAIGSWEGKSDVFDEDAAETLDAVIAHYGKFSAQQLVNLTHSERPWIDARAGLADGERGDREITHSSMEEYYSSL